MRSVFLLFLISLSTCCLTAQTLDANAIKAASNYGFIENKGQVIDQNNQPNPSVKFLCALPDLQVQVRDNGYSYEVKKEIRRIAAPESSGPKSRKGIDLVTYGIHRVDITFDGANQGWLWEASDAQADYSNFYTTGTGEAGITGVRTYRHLLARNVWDYIDIEFLASADAAQPVKYNIIVRPGGNPDAIRLRVAGADASAISSSGGLLLKTDYGDLEETIPFSFLQKGDNAAPENVSIQFREIQKNVFGIQLPDAFSLRGETLVIDPTPDRVWGTWYGGTGDDYGRACSTDNAGDVYVTGETSSNNNIATTGAHQSTLPGSISTYLVKFNASGNRQWATYYGGTNSSTRSWDCASDSESNIYLVGSTGSTSGIATTGAHQTSPNGFPEGYLVKFNQNGIRQWGTYYGGTDYDEVFSCAVDGNNNVYIGGITFSATNISSPGAHQINFGGNVDGFLVKFNSSGIRQWSTYYGGSGSEHFNGIAVDLNGNLLGVGISASTTGIATIGAHQASMAGGGDAFLVKFNPNGIRLWSTYYGGIGNEYFYSCSADASGNIYAVGTTLSTSGIVSSGAHQPSNNGQEEGFVAKFNSSGIRQWATFYGGTGQDYILDCAVEGNGNVYLAGYTIFSDSSIATPNSFQPTMGFFQTSFLAKLNPSGVRLWATYYGGAGFAWAYSCALTSSAQLYLCGVASQGADIPTNGAHQANNGGGNDTYLVKFSQNSCTMTTTVSNLVNACSTQNNGSVTVTPSGGTTPYTYIWSNNQTTQTALNLSPGNYTVTVTDGNGCTATATAIIATIAGPTSSINSVFSCLGQNNGSATVTASGGSTPYTYLWSNGQTTANATNLAVGVYTVTVTGSNGCTTSATTTIANSPAAQAGFTYTINGGQVTFSNTSTNASAYLWEFGNGQTSTQVNPAVTFNTQGIYTVCLTTTGACGTASICQSINMVFDYCMHWQNPYPQGNTLWDVHFINDQIGWAVGDAGTILKSTDGGESWKPQSSPTVESLREVQFANDQIGWAVGGNGIILKTTNGGTLWQFQHSNASLGTLTALHFLDQNTGWAVGENGTILKTSNGGTSWALTQIPPGSNGYPFFWDVFFVNNQTGWAVGFAGAFANTGPKIMKTTDGGTTWNAQSVSVSDGLYAVYFVNDQIGYGVGRFSSVVKTTNGGATWIPQSVNPSNWLIDVRFKDELNGWAVGSSGSVVKTTDGGVNWIQQTSGATTGLYGTFSRDGQTCWTVGNAGTILKSSDNATTWSQKSVGSQAALYDIHFADSQKGWAVGSSGTILKTANGGYIWSVQNSGTLNILNSVFFTDSQTGWAAGYNGTILKSADGGTNWSLQSSGTTKVLRSIFFTDNQIGWAVGDSGIVVKTLNGGASWTVQNVGIDKNFSAVYFLNNQTGWIAGFNGTILKTIDGGNNWTPQTTGTSASLKDINFVDEQTGWAVGGSGTILKTTNGGSTWLVQTSSITTYLNAIKAFNAQTARIVGANGIVLKTSNGGSTWERQLGVTSNDLYSLYMENAQTGWFAGVGGAIIKLGAPTVPQPQNIIRCKNSPPEPLSAAGINLHWYTTPTGGIGSATAPIPNTSTIGTTTYYVSQSPIGIGNCTESERAAIVVTVTAPDISISTTGGCSSNGTATATASGGTAPYSYQWSNNQSTQTISNLPTGTYTVTVTDGSGCAHSETATVAGGVPITASISNTAAPCIGQTNGSLTVNASGGTAPYSYLWSNGQTNANATQLAAGTYFVAVTDNQGCTTTTSHVLSAIAPFEVLVQASPTPGSNTCQASVTPAGGIAPHQYLWSNGQSTATATNLPQGSYNVLVTDATGCVAIGVGDCSTVQTHEIEGLEAFFVAPNPAQAGFTVYAKLAYPSELKIQLVNTLGQHVYESTHYTQEIKEHIPVVNLPAGAYFLKISTLQGYKTEKISIMH